MTTTTCTLCEQDCMCARCGSTMGFEDCQTCPSTGWYDGPDPDCPICDGSGKVGFCLSTAEFCEANPLPGRESTERGVEEWFTIPCPSHSGRGTTHPQGRMEP